MKQKGVVHLFSLLIILIVLLLIGVVAYTMFGGKLNLKVPFLTKKPNVKVEEEYSNPFAKETQYVNPFNEFKNPFVVNR